MDFFGRTELLQQLQDLWGKRVSSLVTCRHALARRPDWNHPIDVTVVEVCGNTGYNWFDLSQP